MGEVTASAGAKMRARLRADDAQQLLSGVPEVVAEWHLQRGEAYVRTHRRKYIDMALAIQPDLDDWRQVWDRVAWAILTANAEYGACREAMQRVTFRVRAYLEDLDRRIAGAPRDGNVIRPVFGGLFEGVAGMTPAKAGYLAALPFGPVDANLLKIWDGETWDAYRLRLRRDVKGLELTKASYAACMLYPMTADVACLDTWVQKAFTWTTRFRSLPLARYRAIEAEVRAIARRYDISTALCQWMLWDCVRGTTTDQRVFG